MASWNGRETYIKITDMDWELYDVNDFYSTYKIGMVNSIYGHAVMDRRRNAIFNGESSFIVYNYEMKDILYHLDEYTKRYGKH